MTVNPERIATLRGYGLTEYQARVYLALLDLGTTNAARIPAVSRVPRSRVYSVLEQLNGKGLTRVLPEKPLRYRPVPLAAYLRGVAQDERRRARALEGALAAVSQEFAVRADAALPDGGSFEAVYGRRNVWRRADGMFGRARREIMGIGTEKSPWRLARSLGGTLRDKTRTGVSVKYAFHVTPENRGEVERLGAYARVRTIDFPMPVVLHGVDGEEFLLSHPIPDDHSPNRGDDIAIWTDDPAIATAMLRIAKRIWNAGMPLAVP